MRLSIEVKGEACVFDLSVVLISQSELETSGILVMRFYGET